MGRSIVYCDLCGGRVLEQDLTAGKATLENGRTFCGSCRLPTPSRPVRSIGVAERAQVGTTSSARSRTARRPSTEGGPRGPLLIGAGVAVVALIVLLAILFGGGTEKKNLPAKPSKEGAVESGKKTPEEPAVPRKDAPPKESAPQDISPKEPNRLDRLLREAGEMAAADPGFERRREVVEVYKQALKEAAGTEALQTRATEAQNAYTRSFEEAADRAWKEIESDVRDLEASNPKGALTRLEDFSEVFRLGRWKLLYDEKRAALERSIR